ncbi:MAG: hypothetical protein KatS3mg002_1341 [Candidatus Woesearchaeota archaeon]|nr:MAG: hypothetical protein KatS3mg002_1341 [Candidatus Woesearchaeota archaeon]
MAKFCYTLTNIDRNRVIPVSNVFTKVDWIAFGKIDLNLELNLYTSLNNIYNALNNPNPEFVFVNDIYNLFKSKVIENEFPMIHNSLSNIENDQRQKIIFKSFSDAGFLVGDRTGNRFNKSDKLNQKYGTSVLYNINKKNLNKLLFLNFIQNIIPQGEEEGVFIGYDPMNDTRSDIFYFENLDDKILKKAGIKNTYIVQTKIKYTKDANGRILSDIELELINRKDYKSPFKGMAGYILFKDASAGETTPTPDSKQTLESVSDGERFLFLFDDINVVIENNDKVINEKIESISSKDIQGDFSKSKYGVFKLFNINQPINKSLNIVSDILSGKTINLGNPIDLKVYAKKYLDRIENLEVDELSMFSNDVIDNIDAYSNLFKLFYIRSIVEQLRESFSNSKEIYDLIDEYIKEIDNILGYIKKKNDIIFRTVEFDKKTIYLINKLCITLDKGFLQILVENNVKSVKISDLEKIIDEHYEKVKNDKTIDSYIFKNLKESISLFLPEFVKDKETTVEIDEEFEEVQKEELMNNGDLVDINESETLFDEESMFLINTFLNMSGKSTLAELTMFLQKSIHGNPDYLSNKDKRDAEIYFDIFKDFTKTINYFSKDSNNLLSPKLALIYMFYVQNSDFLSKSKVDNIFYRSIVNAISKLSKHQYVNPMLTDDTEHPVVSFGDNILNNKYRERIFLNSKKINSFYHKLMLLKILYERYKDNGNHKDKNIIIKVIADIIKENNPTRYKDPALALIDAYTIFNSSIDAIYIKLDELFRSTTMAFGSRLFYGTGEAINEQYYIDVNQLDYININNVNLLNIRNSLYKYLEYISNAIIKASEESSNIEEFVNVFNKYIKDSEAGVKENPNLYTNLSNSLLDVDVLKSEIGDIDDIDLITQYVVSAFKACIISVSLNNETLKYDFIVRNNIIKSKPGEINLNNSNERVRFNYTERLIENVFYIFESVTRTKSINVSKQQKVMLYNNTSNNIETLNKEVRDKEKISSSVPFGGVISNIFADGYQIIPINISEISKDVSKYLRAATSFSAYGIPIGESNGLKTTLLLPLIARNNPLTLSNSLFDNKTNQNNIFGIGGFFLRLITKPIGTKIKTGILIDDKNVYTGDSMVNGFRPLSKFTLLDGKIRSDIYFNLASMFTKPLLDFVNDNGGISLNNNFIAAANGKFEKFKHIDSVLMYERSKEEYEKKMNYVNKLSETINLMLFKTLVGIKIEELSINPELANIIKTQLKEKQDKLEDFHVKIIDEINKTNNDEIKKEFLRLLLYIFHDSRSEVEYLFNVFYDLFLLTASEKDIFEEDINVDSIKKMIFKLKKVIIDDFVKSYIGLENIDTFNAVMNAIYSKPFNIEVSNDNIIFKYNNDQISIKDNNKLEGLNEILDIITVTIAIRNNITKFVTFYEEIIHYDIKRAKDISTKIDLLFKYQYIDDIVNELLNEKELIDANISKEKVHNFFKNIKDRKDKFNGIVKYFSINNPTYNLHKMHDNMLFKDNRSTIKRINKKYYIISDALESMRDINMYSYYPAYHLIQSINEKNKSLNKILDNYISNVLKEAYKDFISKDSIQSSYSWQKFKQSIKIKKYYNIRKVIEKNRLIYDANNLRFKLAEFTMNNSLAIEYIEQFMFGDNHSFLSAVYNDPTGMSVFINEIVSKFIGDDKLVNEESDAGKLYAFNILMSELFLSYTKFNNDPHEYKLKDNQKRNNLSPKVVFSQLHFNRIIGNNNWVIKDNKFKVITVDEVLYNAFSKSNDVYNNFLRQFTDYTNIEFFNGHGYIPLEVYRALAIQTQEWNEKKESTYRKIISGQRITLDEMLLIMKGISLFKVHYSGPLINSSVYFRSQDKFALFPIHPNITKYITIGDNRQETNILDSLYYYMKSNGIHYINFESGGKQAYIKNTKPENNKLIINDNGIMLFNEKNKEIVVANISEKDIRFLGLNSFSGKEQKTDVKINVKFTLFLQASKVALYQLIIEKLEEINSLSDLNNNILMKIETFKGIYDIVLDIARQNNIKDEKEILNIIKNTVYKSLTDVINFILTFDEMREYSNEVMKSVFNFSLRDFNYEKFNKFIDDTIHDVYKDFSSEQKKVISTLREEMKMLGLSETSVPAIKTKILSKIKLISDEARSFPGDMAKQIPEITDKYDKKIFKGSIKNNRVLHPFIDTTIASRIHYLGKMPLTENYVIKEGELFEFNGYIYRVTGIKVMTKKEIVEDAKNKNIPIDVYLKLNALNPIVFKRIKDETKIKIVSFEGVKEYQSFVSDDVIYIDNEENINRLLNNSVKSIDKDTIKLTLIDQSGKVHFAIISKKAKKIITDYRTDKYKTDYNINFVDFYNISGIGFKLSNSFRDLLPILPTSVIVYSGTYSDIEDFILPDGTILINISSEEYSGPENRFSNSVKSIAVFTQFLYLLNYLKNNNEELFDSSLMKNGMINYDKLALLLFQYGLIEKDYLISIGLLKPSEENKEGENYLVDKNIEEKLEDVVKSISTRYKALLEEIIKSNAPEKKKNELIRKLNKDFARINILLTKKDFTLEDLKSINPKLLTIEFILFMSKQHNIFTFLNETTNFKKKGSFVDFSVSMKELIDLLIIKDFDRSSYKKLKNIKKIDVTSMQESDKMMTISVDYDEAVKSFDLNDAYLLFFRLPNNDIIGERYEIINLMLTLYRAYEYYYENNLSDKESLLVEDIKQVIQRLNLSDLFDIFIKDDNIFIKYKGVEYDLNVWLEKAMELYNMTESVNWRSPLQQAASVSKFYVKSFIFGINSIISISTMATALKGADYDNDSVTYLSRYFLLKVNGKENIKEVENIFGSKSILYTHNKNIAYIDIVKLAISKPEYLSKLTKLANNTDYQLVELDETDFKSIKFKDDDIRLLYRKKVLGNKILNSSSRLLSNPDISNVFPVAEPKITKLINKGDKRKYASSINKIKATTKGSFVLKSIGNTVYAQQREANVPVHSNIAKITYSDFVTYAVDGSKDDTGIYIYHMLGGPYNSTTEFNIESVLSNYDNFVTFMKKLKNVINYLSPYIKYDDKILQNVINSIDDILKEVEAIENETDEVKREYINLFNINNSHAYRLYDIIFFAYYYITYKNAEFFSNIIMLMNLKSRDKLTRKDAIKLLNIKKNQSYNAIYDSVKTFRHKKGTNIDKETFKEILTDIKKHLKSQITSNINSLYNAVYKSITFIKKLEEKYTFDREKLFLTIVDIYSYRFFINEINNSEVLSSIAISSTTFQKRKYSEMSRYSLLPTISNVGITTIIDLIRYLSNINKSSIEEVNRMLEITKELIPIISNDYFGLFDIDEEGNIILDKTLDLYITRTTKTVYYSDKIDKLLRFSINNKRKISSDLIPYLYPEIHYVLKRLILFKGLNVIKGIYLTFLKEEGMENVASLALSVINNTFKILEISKTSDKQENILSILAINNETLINKAISFIFNSMIDIVYEYAESIGSNIISEHDLHMLKQFYKMDPYTLQLYNEMILSSYLGETKEEKFKTKTFKTAVNNFEIVLDLMNKAISQKSSIEYKDIKMYYFGLKNLGTIMQLYNLIFSEKQIDIPVDFITDFKINSSKISRLFYMIEKFNDFSSRFSRIYEKGVKEADIKSFFSSKTENPIRDNPLITFLSQNVFLPMNRIPLIIFLNVHNKINYEKYERIANIKEYKVIDKKGNIIEKDKLTDYISNMYHRTRKMMNEQEYTEEDKRNAKILQYPIFNEKIKIVFEKDGKQFTEELTFFEYILTLPIIDASYSEELYNKLHNELYILFGAYIITMAYKYIKPEELFNILSQSMLELNVRSGFFVPGLESKFGKYLISLKKYDILTSMHNAPTYKRIAEHIINIYKSINRMDMNIIKETIDQIVNSYSGTLININRNIVKEINDLINYLNKETYINKEVKKYIIDSILRDVNKRFSGDIYNNFLITSLLKIRTIRNKNYILYDDTLNELLQFLDNDDAKISKSEKIELIFSLIVSVFENKGKEITTKDFLNLIRNNKFISSDVKSINQILENYFTSNFDEMPIQYDGVLYKSEDNKTIERINKEVLNLFGYELVKEDNILNLHRIQNQTILSKC